MHPRVLSVSLILLLALTACVDELTTSSVTAEVVNGNNDPCPKTGCGTNSPFLGPTEFHELESTGTFANAEGFRVLGLIKGGWSYIPDVTGAVLSGKLWGISVLQHQDLVGAELQIVNDVSKQVFRIRIDRVVQAQQYWRAPLDTFETYELSWHIEGPATHATAVCNNPPDRLDPDGNFYGDVMEAILFTGDRYDATKLTVTATTKRASGTWFNIACAGNVMSKLFLNRHTDASQTAAFPTNLEQRQAMLKMYTSDLCGTGQAFTVQGTPLHWVSSAGWSSIAGNYPNKEALWTSQGALCLDTHRLNKTLNDMSLQYNAACTLRPCTTSTSTLTLANTNAYLQTSSPATP